MAQSRTEKKEGVGEKNSQVEEIKLDFVFFGYCGTYAKIEGPQIGKSRKSAKTLVDKIPIFWIESVGEKEDFDYF